MRRALVAVLVCAGVAGGCGREHGHAGKSVAEYPPDKGEHRLRPRPVYGHTTAPAVYVLYARQARPPTGWEYARKVRGGWELGAWRLPKRSRLGFRPEPGGGVVAVAGRDETRLPAGRYCWHAKPGSSPIDWGATALLTVVVAGLVVGGIAAWWSAEFSDGWGGGGGYWYY